MSFVSKHKLDTHVEKKLYAQLADLFTAHQGKRASTQLMYELFTPTERLMFAKRVAIITLLERKYSSYSIALALHVSESTVMRIDARRQKGAYTHMIKTIQNKEYRKSLIGTLETLLTIGAPGVATRKIHQQIRNDIESWKSGK